MNTWTVIILIIAALIILVLFASVVYFYQQNSRMLKRNAEISSRNTSLEMHRLKFALQPHTLNNVLAHLKAMSNKISRSMDSLSELLEYIFYHGEEHLVSIKEEVEFINSYVHLQDVFTKEVEAIQLNTDGLNINSTKYGAKSIPHLITAYLIENAFKHGDIDHPEFLKVTLTSTENSFSIHVKNKIRKNYTPRKKGTGLNNMHQRLKILKEGKYNFETAQTEEDFSAALTITI
jgi:LytS/YehU family sensor histidine kinase